MLAFQKPINNVPQEQVEQYHFLPWDVYKTPGRRKQRFDKLMRALTISNDSHNEVKIYFVTEDEEVVSTESTLWMVGETHISLKGGRMIPVHAILDVEY
jgi:hypothetical protein